MIADIPARFRVLAADGEIITGGVTESNATLLDVMEAIQRLKERPEAQRERTPHGWTIERE